VDFHRRVVILIFPEMYYPNVQTNGLRDSSIDRWFCCRKLSKIWMRESPYGSEAWWTWRIVNIGINVGGNPLENPDSFDINR
jgi:hypothetical protein